MLAQNFKTPVDLGITNAEFDALAKVLGMMEREEIKPAPGGAVFDRRDANGQEPTMFRMASVVGYADCGTACCILGWAQHVTDAAIFNYGGNHSTEELFFPSGKTNGILCRDPAQAAVALRNYLTHGEPRWEEALSA